MATLGGCRGQPALPLAVSYGQAGGGHHAGVSRQPGEEAADADQQLPGLEQAGQRAQPAGTVCIQKTTHPNVHLF